MKKKLLLTFFVLAAVCLGHKAQAQAAPASTAPVTVNINLQDVLSIALGASPTVTFTYGTVASYSAAQTVPKSNHLTVISNRNYDIGVTAQAEFVPASPTDIPLDLVEVEIEAAATGATSIGPLPLENAVKKTLITTAPASILTGTSFNVNYSIPTPTGFYDLPKINYSTTVIYTATQL